jgi:transcriptional regulator NrdR family protein
VNRISDEQLMFETFKDDPVAYVRLAVVHKLSDVQSIQTFENDPVEYVRGVVAEKLSDITEFSDALAELSNESLNLP